MRHKITCVKKGMFVFKHKLNFTKGNYLYLYHKVLFIAKLLEGCSLRTTSLNPFRHRRVLNHANLIDFKKVKEY